MIATIRSRARDRDSRPALRLGGLLIALLCLYATLSATTTPPATAAGRSRSLCSAERGCTGTAPLAHTSDSEAEETEEEPQEAGEEAATAEVEAEEAEAESGTSGPSNPRAAGSDTVVLSHLRLTAGASAALAHRLPTASSIGFSFTLSAPTEVRFTIVRETGIAATKAWKALPDSLTQSIAKGHATRSLKGHNRLSPGRYRLTAIPTGGSSRSIYLTVGR